MGIQRSKPVIARLQYAVLSVLIVPVAWVNASPLSLSTVPLFLGTGVEANIVMTLDDSGSMHWEYMPSDNWTYFIFPRANSIYGGGDYYNGVPEFDNTLSYSVRARSPDVNAIYYNPETTYVPWSTDSGGSMGDALITCAPHNPYNTGAGCRVLTGNNTQTAFWESYDGNGANFPAGLTTDDDSRTFWPAVYYRYTGGVYDGTTDWDAGNYTEYRIDEDVSATYPGGTGRTDCGVTPTSCTYAQEIQNFANWYTYYRSRVLTARAGIGRAFASQGTNIRVAFAAINVGSTVVDGVTSDRGMVRGVRTFSGEDRETFYDDLYGHVMPRSGTPLRSALEAVGDYYERTDDDGPWSEAPGDSSSESHLECRQSFNILMTDGYYNGGDPGAGNVDNTAGTTITSVDGDTFLYTPGAPYSDGHTDTLADMAMHYWVRDLRTDVDNNVPTSESDEAFWQHMVNFTIGLGVDGTLDPVASYSGIADGSISWPDPEDGSEERIDDLWHAGLNSRGGFYSAADPESFAEELSNILSDISDRIGSASAVALNSGSINSDSKLYQARFDSSTWIGQLLAYPINSDGSFGSLLWDAASLIPAANSRVIITFDGTDPQSFQWTDLSTAQRGHLGMEAVLDYLRGDTSFEASNITSANDAILVADGFASGGFRNRTSLLGDIVHSSPAYLGSTNYYYPDDWGSSGVDEPEDSSYYSSFVTWQRLLNSGDGRSPMVYVGANDGMLHAFDADTGVEVFAYVPNAIYSNLVDLTNPARSHKFYVDGAISTVDAFVGGSWKTVLVGSLRGGGQGIYAIDVTNPSAFSAESTAASKVLWEFTDSDTNSGSAINSNFDADLGYTFGRASIVRLHNGKWAAVFGNGYNNTVDNDNDGANSDSTTGNAVLYIVDLETGNLIRKIDTGKGSSDDLTLNNYPNGLSEPALVDFDGDSIVDFAYAGDLQGNLWKFDLTDTDAASWSVAHSQPLFNACSSTTCTDSTYQPITSRPQVGLHPESGLLVYFGTGKYFEDGDNIAAGQTNQTFYAIWDKNLSTFTAFNRDNLLEQVILFETSLNDQELRVTSDYEIDWTSHLGWHMDLYNQESGSSGNEGERQVNASALRNGTIIFNTLVPDDGDPCAAGGTSWLMLLSPFSGARLAYAPLDLNDDGEFDEEDYVEVNLNGDGVNIAVSSSGRKSKVGITGAPGMVSNDGASGGGVDYAVTSGSGGDLESVRANAYKKAPGRESWRYLEN